MALTDEARGPRAAWLRRNRRERFGSGEGGLAKLSDALRQQGLDRSPTTIKGWESSDERSPIPPDALPVLERLFGEPAPRPVSNATSPELVSALHAQTQALADLVIELRGNRGVIVAEAKSPYGDVDDKTRRTRRAYWIARALEEETPPLNATAIAKRMGWSTSQLGPVRSWLRGDIPEGATRAAFAQAVMLPLQVLEEPPPTDHERLVEWRRESVAELPAPAREEPPARQRRSA